jgi:hypothetical protein
MATRPGPQLRPVTTLDMVRNSERLRIIALRSATWPREGVSVAVATMASQQTATSEMTRQRTSDERAGDASRPAGRPRRHGVEPGLWPSRVPPVGGQVGHEAPLIVHEVLRGPSAPLDVGTRNVMEKRFGADLSHVRVHADGRAAASALAVNATAYTVGSSIVFGKGRYAPHQQDEQQRRRLGDGDTRRWRQRACPAKWRAGDAGLAAGSSRDRQLHCR